MVILLDWIKQYGLAGIFVSLGVENIGVPLPTEGAFLVAQHYIYHGIHSFWFMFWFMVAAHMIGAILAYGAGRLFSRAFAAKLDRSPKFRRAHDQIRTWYGKYGSVTVLATRLIGYVRPWSSIVAGLAEYPFGPFLLWSFIGTLLIVYITMKVTALLVIVWQRFPAGPIVISLLVLAGFLGFLLFFRRKRH